MMILNSIALHQAASHYTRHADLQPEEAEGTVFLVGDTEEYTEPEDSAALYKGLSEKYDVRQATFGEIVEMSNALYEAGEISLKEHAVLTFDYDRAANNLKRQAPGYVPVDFTMFETVAASNGQRDWISEFGARAAKDFKFGNLAGFQSHTKMLDILERLSR
ncbi:hypothetical protein [Sporosarcina cascadiensis]|uniref:hypothetical protein n=1 Tax=Sporosarcina cascadiensis TaxID=2660747 RepID=UPI00129A69DE|nr:hypothetical protein [Sporosarcina cascadiensis]